MAKTIKLRSNILGYDFESNQTNDFIRACEVHTSILGPQQQKDSVENKPANYLLHRWEKHLAGFLHLIVIDRWSTISKRARYSALIVFS